MTEPISDQLKRIAAAGDIGVILHIGAGEGAELAGYLAANADHIRLMEPNPAAAAALQQIAAGVPTVQVDGRAVTGQDSVAVLHVFNLAPYSSLHAPRELARMFPGLHVASEPEVATIAVSSLMADIPFTRGRRNVLVLDAPGEEGNIVEALRAGSWLHRFEHVFLYCGTSQLYQNSRTVKELRDILESEGYRLAAMLEDDPDRPCLVLHVDLTARKVESLEHENRKLTAKVEQLLARNNELETAQAHGDEQIAQMKELLARNRKLEATQQRLTGEMHRAEGQIELIKDLLLREVRL